MLMRENVNKDVCKDLQPGKNAEDPVDKFWYEIRETKKTWQKQKLTLLHLS